MMIAQMKKEVLRLYGLIKDEIDLIEENRRTRLDAILRCIRISGRGRGTVECIRLWHKPRQVNWLLLENEGAFPLDQRRT